jgi:hypothetical protein
MLATSSTVTARLEIKLVQRIDSIVTTAFTSKPVSMKYRGIFELVGRSPGKLNYASQIRHQTPAAIYAEWFQRFVANARHPGAAGRPNRLRKNPQRSSISWVYRR